jgi:hypothetical protein
MDADKQRHWETVYETKSPDQVSWTQAVPRTSLDFILSFGLPKTATIIDIGGGDSRLADGLLEKGFNNITVLDISAKALERARRRLGPKARNVTWIVSDIVDFEPAGRYDLWHDRAAFHFLTDESQIAKYVKTATAAVSGYMVLGTFSDAGPKKCSGLDISQYDAPTLQARFAAGFEPIQCRTEDHVTPFDTVQNFLFCSFKKK